jgi:NAD(P)H-flavin reductase
MTENIYMPYLMRLEKVTYEAPGVKTFMLKFVNEDDQKSFSFRAGQFGEYSVYGTGESTFCIASSPTRIYRVYLPANGESNKCACRLRGGKHNRLPRTLRKCFPYR